jgi:GT2 family glycosyltransferase
MHTTNTPAGAPAPTTRISFVVPTKNSARTISACVRSLRMQHYHNVEIVVVDNHSTDRTAELAARYADRVIVAGPERCAQRNIGARDTIGDVVVFIDSDMVLEPGIAGELAIAHEAGVADAWVLPELAFGENFFASCRGLEKRLYLGDPSVEAARAFRRDFFEMVDGWDETLTAGEDWDLTDRMRAVGARFDRSTSRVWHDEGHVGLRSQFKKKRYYGAWVAAFLQRGGGKGHLARTSLVAQPRLLLSEPSRAAGLFVLKAVEAAGLATGMAQGRLRRSPASA